MSHVFGNVPHAASHVLQKVSVGREGFNEKTSNMLHD